MPRARPSLSVPDQNLDIFIRRHPQVFEPDTHRILFALRAVAQRVNDRANEWLAPLGLTVGKYNYLVALGSAQNQSLALNEIAGLIHTKSATVTQMIAALERDGFVRRKNNPTDGRSTLAQLTPRGEALLREAMVAHHLRLEECIRHVSGDERRKLFSLLLKIGDGFAEGTEPVGARPAEERAR